MFDLEVSILLNTLSTKDLQGTSVTLNNVSGTVKNAILAMESMT